MPAFVSTLCICIVFVPMFFLTGVAHYLFVPLAEAVVFAMLASYVLSRTLVPTLVMWFYRNVQQLRHAPAALGLPPSTNRASARGAGRLPLWLRPLAAVQTSFERGFDRFREGYRILLGAVLHHRRPLCGDLSGCSASARCCSCRSLGRTSFPRWMPGNSGCTSAPGAARASRKPPNWWTRSRPPSAGKSPPRNSAACWTTSAFPPPASI